MVSKGDCLWRGLGQSPRLVCFALAAVVGMPAGRTLGQATEGQSSPTGSTPSQSVPQSAQPTNPPSPGATGTFAQQILLGDAFGARPALGHLGVSIGLTQTSEVLGNATGGVRQGADYEGLALASVGLDTGKAFGWTGGTFNASALWVQGRNLSAENLLTVQTASGIEAQRSVRLWELWYDQRFADGLGDVKIGQQSADQEFMTSTYSTLFINTVMGWPGVPSNDLYDGGGPAYPLASLGAWLRGVFGPLTAQIGVYDDNPAGGSFYGDGQIRGAERTGSLFNLGGGALTIGELDLAINQPDLARPNAKPSGLPGTYRIGGWFDTGSFPDQRIAADGLALANPASDGPRLLRHDFSLYFSGDQELWQDAAGVRSAGLFLRTIGAPNDRNLLSFSGDVGLTIKAPFTSRPNDSVGLGYGIVKFSQSASEADADRRRFVGAGYPIRSSESFVELTYQAQIAPWWQVQPDAQYVWTPGGGVTNPLATAATPSRVGNEAVVGVRTTVSF